MATKVVGYVRVSTDDQARSGLGLAAQRAAIADEARRRGWELVRVYEDAGTSAKTVEHRPGLKAALDAVEGGQANGLVVSKIDRLSRSVVDFANLMARSRKKGWELVALDQGLDTTTPVGVMTANMLAVFAQFERDLIAERTADGLAEARKKGTWKSRRGNTVSHLGRYAPVAPAIAERIVAMSQGGASLNKIARTLTAEGVPTSVGGPRWYASVVKRVVDRAAQSVAGGDSRALKARRGIRTKMTAADEVTSAARKAGT
jgi:DNA invertase Pin-like site-specific DNA recombinase